MPDGATGEFPAPGNAPDRRRFLPGFSILAGTQGHPGDFQMP